MSLWAYSARIKANVDHHHCPVLSAEILSPNFLQIKRLSLKQKFVLWRLA